jgi:hypothetical protein
MITLDNLDQFKSDYINAVKEGKDVFIFEGSEVLVSFARFVIEYFDTIVNQKS